MQTHKLKIWPEYFEKVLQGSKTFEVRRDDRGFEEGDRVVLQEYDINKNKYSGRELSFQIGEMIYSVFGLKDGFCAFSLLPDTFGLTPHAADSEHSDGDWLCKNCNCANLPTDQNCTSCGTPRHS